MHQRVAPQPDVASHSKDIDESRHSECGTSIQVQRSFFDGFCHSRTLMSRGVLAWDEKKRLAASRRSGCRCCLPTTPRWVTDSYVWPVLVQSCVLSVLEVALLCVAPAYFRGLEDDLGRSGALLAPAGILASLSIGQAVGARWQWGFLRTLQRCPLPVPVNVATMLEHSWERSRLNISIVAFFGLTLHAASWYCVFHYFCPRAHGWVQVALLASGSCLLGWCRPGIETSLQLGPRRGHADGRTTVSFLHVAFILRTLTAAVALPLLVMWCRRKQPHPRAVEVDVSASAVVLRRVQDNYGIAEAVLALLPVLLMTLPLLAIVPWSARANRYEPFRSPVRRALHFTPPVHAASADGPVLPSRPVVSKVRPLTVGLCWRSPYTAASRSLIFDLEATMDGGKWVPGVELGVVWPRDRNLPRCSVPLARLPSGGAVQFRVRCASCWTKSIAVADAASAAEHGYDADLLWGPWSQPSLLVHKPRGLRFMVSCQPLLFLLCIPLDVIDTLLVALPRAWLRHVSRRGMVLECMALLLVLWPLVILHFLFWVLPRQMWYRLSAPQDAASQARSCWTKALVCLVLVASLPVCAILIVIDSFVKKVRHARQIEKLPLCEDVGSIVDLRVSACVTSPSEGGGHCGSDGEGTRVLHLALVHTRKKASISADCHSTVAIGSTVLSRCAGAALAREALYLSGDAQSWVLTNFGKRLWTQDCILVVRVRASIPRLEDVLARVSGLGVLAIIVDVDFTPEAHQNKALDIPVLCVDAATADRIESALGEGLRLGCIAAAAPRAASVALSAAWVLHGDRAAAYSKRPVCLQVRQQLHCPMPSDLPWTAVAWARLSTSSVTVPCTVPLGDGKLEFRLVGTVEGARQRLSDIASLHLMQPPEPEGLGDSSDVPAHQQVSHFKSPSRSFGDLSALQSAVASTPLSLPCVQGPPLAVLAAAAASSGAPPPTSSSQLRPEDFSSVCWGVTIRHPPEDSHQQMVSAAFNASPLADLVAPTQSISFTSGRSRCPSEEAISPSAPSSTSSPTRRRPRRRPSQMAVGEAAGGGSEVSAGALVPPRPPPPPVPYLVEPPSLGPPMVPHVQAWPRHSAAPLAPLRPVADPLRCRGGREPWERLPWTSPLPAGPPRFDDVAWLG